MIDIRIEKGHVEIEEIRGTGTEIVADLMCWLAAICELVSNDAGKECAEGLLLAVEKFYRVSKDLMIVAPKKRGDIFTGSMEDFLNG